MILQALVVADPVGNVAELITSQCRRLAQQRLVATHGEQILGLCAEFRPELVLLSLEMAHPPLEQLIPKLIKLLPDVLLIATFRELSVPHLEQLNRLGVDDFLAQPLQASELFLTVARRFAVSFRRRPRYPVRLEVHRPDGAL